MRAHVLQHVPFEGLAGIGSWLESHHAEVTFTRFFAGEDLPDLEGIDLVVALGGPMSVNDEAELPWLVAEKAFVRDAVARGKAFLGVCLGAQLMASALGAAVYASPHKEVGWFPISRVPGSLGFEFPERVHVFHWHGETFDLPTGALWLARSEGVAHQAFQVGDRAVGLQFHLEMTESSIATIVHESPDDLASGPYVQAESELMPGYATHGARTQGLLGSLLDYLTRPPV